jgi:2-dehydro-3-deoxyphosphogluconate aldolase/(4S)-4-hydroxy-2-oxoglutarate aldolase
MKAEVIKEIIKQEKMVPILRTDSIDVIEHIAEAVVEAGVKILEYTMTIRGIIQQIGKIKAKFPGLIIGLGTVLEKEDAKKAIDNGVDFIVSPICNYDIVDTVKSKDKMLMLSGFTPTEIYNAHRAGSDFVKLFPASEMEPTFIQKIKGPFPNIEVFPTGGLDLIGAIQFLSHGAVAVGMGETVFKKELIRDRNFEEISALLRNANHRIKNMEI